MSPSLPTQRGKTHITARIEQFLREANVPYHLLEHEPVYTSDEAARVRETLPEEGAKALVVKADDRDYYHIVLPGH